MNSYLRILVTILLSFFVNNCSSMSVKNSINFEVSNYIDNNIAQIPIYINKSNNIISLKNASSAEQIILYFYINSLLDKKDLNITIECMSKCAIDFMGDFNHIYIKNLKLINAYFIKNLSIKVGYLQIESSEALKTGLPIVVKEAAINIEPSNDMIAVQKTLGGVNIIPGSGEFVYDTEVVYNSNLKPINSHNDQNIADALSNLKSLESDIANLKWVAPVISWFGVNIDKNKIDIDVSNLKIVPGVENNQEEASTVWLVDKYNRKMAYLISKDASGRPNYGGTLNDLSLINYIDALKQNKLKIMFYPLLLMDLPGKPWRGFIKADNPKDVELFFNKVDGYNQFILHYANLLKGKIDAFVIGSEMQDLTQSIDLNYNYPDPRRYPAVVELIKLAKKVKQILGRNVIVTYAANWSEYHHNKNKYHHLDSLWSSEFIDVVGIDAYLPITNKSMGDISIEEIKKGWSSGELWDYYYDRNKKSDIPPEWGLKQIEFWWKNEHWRKGIKSAWKPKMKPIWFTEFGFPSMNLSTNTPNSFWNPKSVEGGTPKKSSGRPDFAIQMRAIRGTLEYWHNKKDIVQNMFLWAWDVRPFPYYPKRLDIWSDGDLWSRGHWINGKIKPLSQVRLLPGFESYILKVNAEELILEGNNNRISKVIAKNIKNLP